MEIIPVLLKILDNLLKTHPFGWLDGTDPEKSMGFNAVSHHTTNI